MEVCDLIEVANPFGRGRGEKKGEEVELKKIKSQFGSGQGSHASAKARKLFELMFGCHFICTPLISAVCDKIRTRSRFTSLYLSLYPNIDEGKHDRGYYLCFVQSERKRWIATAFDVTPLFLSLYPKYTRIHLMRAAFSLIY